MDKHTIRPVHILKKTHYSELTPAEWKWLRKVGIVNGYGPSSQPILRWILARIAPAFKHSNADIHDFTHWQGGDEEQRLKNDRGFFLRLCEDSIDTGWWMLYYVPLSVLYY